MHAAADPESRPAGWGACTGVTVVAGSRKARAARRRKRRMDRVDHDLSDAQWTALKAAWGGCAYCGASTTPLQRDCVLALSRGETISAGGTFKASSGTIEGVH